ncbi:hypothetical protein STCU_07823 [Strigomonas culicis]|uniref:J domain-containing protein n=1 Tax=Strigomonas culicis TaxID=28005 RepID=S9V8A0_9TRYP|nr:hypothetical protein STCU_07823 [Strigomonas culicis]|eukprot:EPY23196.1 hypothetical protein STCU_07823 [Strigomonas culicis]
MSNTGSSGNPLLPPYSTKDERRAPPASRASAPGAPAASKEKEADADTTKAATRAEEGVRPERGVVARRQPPRHVQRHAAQLAALSHRRGFLQLTPMEQRIALGTGKVAISIADGLLSSSRLINPMISAALVVYGVVNIVQGYRHGELNRLGYQTTGTDVALRIGKEVGMMGVGFGIGAGVGALIAFSSIPVVGQLVLATVLSAVLGLCVGTLITRYVDRLFVRLQIRSQYKYPADEKGARRRFEELIAERHDLCNLDTCRVVQHYADYRVASGWESPNDIDDYRNSGGDTRFMPVSFQHFAIVQLERKWGFLRQRAACRKVFKALMLTHHPDRGGSASMAAQLKNDYEVYAFCNRWLEDCPILLSAEVDPEVGVSFEPQPNTRRRNPVSDFLRSLFRPATNSAMDADDLHQFGLLTVDGAGTASASNLRHLDDELAKAEGSFSEDSDSSEMSYQRSKLGLAIQQHSIKRVLSALQQTYQGVAEIATFAGLIRVYEQPAAWKELQQCVRLFNRMQSYVRVTTAMRKVQATHRAPAETTHCCGDFVWSNLPQAIEKREGMRKAIIAAVFTEQTNRQLESAMDLWRSGKQITENYFKQCGEGADRSTESASNILDTLMRIQQKLEELGQEEQEPWKDKVQAWAAQTSSPSGAMTLMDEIKNVGVTASTALAGEHARGVHASVTECCEKYFHSWKKTHETLVLMEDELQEVESDVRRLSAALEKGGAADHAARAREQDTLVQRAQDYNVKILLVQKQAAEVDQHIEELNDICLYYYPEFATQVEQLPSTCVMCIDEGAFLPRWIRFERERTAACYAQVELEVQGPIDAARCGRHTADDDQLYVFDLLQATYTNPMDGTMAPCWLKRYALQPTPEDVDAAARRAHRATQVQQVRQLLRYELRTAKACHSALLLHPTDAFYDVRMREIYFHLPRDSTQQRFGSIHDVQRRILPKGVQWLNDALQCLIDLHYSRTAHGDLGLSSFTYDEFGKTMLGFFAPLPSASQPLEEESMYLGGGGGDDGDSASSRAAREKDVIDFAGLLVSEVIPYLGGGGSTAAAGRRTPTPPPQDYETKQQDTRRIFQEVADRLLGKMEPRWSLVDARSFVRRCLQFDFENAERQYTFSKVVTYPVSWAFYRVTTPIVVTAEHRMHLKVSGTRRCQLFLNKNLSLWTTYWRCRRKMTLKRMGSFPQPQAVRQKKHLLPCSDDCEVNERYMWFACRDEEEVWSLCLNGFFLLSGDAFARLHFGVPEEGSSWGVVCRVAAGTVLEADVGVGGGGGLSPRSAQEAQESVWSHAAVRRCHLSTNAEELLVPSPWARCYPEFIAQLFDQEDARAQAPET